MEAGRDLEKRGRDGPQLTTAPGAGRRPSLPRRFCLCLCHPPPPQCRLPDPCPPRSRRRVPRRFSPMKFPGHAADHMCSRRRHRAPGAMCWWCALLGMAGSDPSSPWGPASPCWKPPLPVEPPLLAGSCRQECPGSPLSKPEPLGTAEPALSSSHRWHSGLPQPIPTCSLLNTLAQPHPPLMGPTWAAPASSWSPSGTGVIISPSPGPHSSHSLWKK